MSSAGPNLDALLAKAEQSEDDDTIPCPSCAELIKAEAKKCRHCGAVIGMNKAATSWNAVPKRAPLPHKSRVGYIFLGLFVGLLGIHNFYAGYAGKGLAQLLLSLLIGWLWVPLYVVGIWVLIEIITVDEDAAGRPMA